MQQGPIPLPLWLCSTPSQRDVSLARPHMCTCLFDHPVLWDTYTILYWYHLTPIVHWCHKITYIFRYDCLQMPGSLASHIWYRLYGLFALLESGIWWAPHVIYANIYINVCVCKNTFTYPSQSKHRYGIPPKAARNGTHRWREIRHRQGSTECSPPSSFCARLGGDADRLPPNALQTVKLKETLWAYIQKVYVLFGTAHMYVRYIVGVWLKW